MLVLGSTNKCCPHSCSVPMHSPDAQLTSVCSYAAAVPANLNPSFLPCSWLKKERIARKLAVGFESFKVINQPKTDVNLRFSTVNMQHLAGLLDPTEQEEFLLLWKPQLGGKINNSSSSVLTATTAAVLAGKESKAPGSPVSSTGTAASLIRVKPAKRVSDGSDDSSACSDTETVADSDCGASVVSVASSGGPAARDGAVLSPEQQEEVRKMRGIPIEWRAFHINLGAFLYTNLFQMKLPPAVMPISKPEVARWLKIKKEDRVIHHNFKLYK